MNESACDATTLYHCTENSQYDKRDRCDTSAQCTAGLVAGACGMCDPGKFRCTDALLEACNDTGNWEMKETCASPDLCKETKGLCDTMVCAKDEYRCMTDDLQTCNTALTAFESAMPCEPGLCNAEAKRCNECKPESKVCESPSALSVCDMAGMKKSQACPEATRFCDDKTNECVQCMAPTDCPAPTSECATTTCTDGKCTAGDPKPLKTACNSAPGAGVCDVGGNCVKCVTDSDCNDPQLRCIIVACVTRDVLQTSRSLLGGYTVTISAGYSATVDNVGCAAIQPGNGSTLAGSATQSITYTLTGLPDKPQACDPLPQATRGLDPVSLTFGAMAPTPQGGFPTGGCAADKPMCTVTIRPMELKKSP
jgi:hypothetical protein